MKIDMETTRPERASKNCARPASPKRQLIKIFGFLLAMLPIFTLTAVRAHAQTQVFPQWTATIKNFSPSAIASDSLGNTYLTGFATIATGSTSHQEMLTAKYDPDGRLLWKAWLGSAVHPAQGIEIGLDVDSNIYVLGSIATQNGGLEFATAKYNTNGTRQWVDYFFRPDDGQAVPAHLAVSTGGSAYVTGTSSFERTTSRAFGIAIKYDTNGNQIWTRTIENCCNTVTSVGIALDAHENVYWALFQIFITGAVLDTNIYKYDPNGNLLNTRSTGEGLSAFRLDSQGNAYVAGTTNFQDSNGDEQPIVSEFKAVGPGWTDVLGPLGSGFPQVASLTPNSDGSVFVSPVPGGAGLTKFSPTGVQLWTVQNSGLLAANSVGDVYVAGSTITKYDPKGVLIWQQLFEGPSHQPATPTAITIGGDGGLFVTGATTINGAPASVTIDYVQDAAKLTPASLTFGNQVLGTQSPAKTVTLKNTAEQSLQVTSITADGDFHQTNHCPATLAPGASCTVTITFLPTKLGARTGTLTVLDAYEGSPQTAKLSGTGTSQ